MKKLKETVPVFLLGSVAYSLLEMIWRGFTHWTMTLTGGVCFAILYHLYNNMEQVALWKKCTIGSGVITGIEFLVGCVVNLGLKWNVWDYSGFHFHLFGQICALYSGLWFFLSVPIVYLSRRVKGLLRKEPTSLPKKLAA